jgi:hypothetical protein
MDARMRHVHRPHHLDGKTPGRLAVPWHMHLPTTSGRCISLKVSVGYMHVPYVAVRLTAGCKVSECRRRNVGAVRALIQPTRL